MLVRHDREPRLRTNFLQSFQPREVRQSPKSYQNGKSLPVLRDTSNALPPEQQRTRHFLVRICTWRLRCNSIDPTSSMTVQQLIAERVKVRGALVSLKSRPHASNPATAAMLCEKLKAINAGIQVLCWAACLSSLFLIAVLSGQLLTDRVSSAPLIGGSAAS